MASAVEPSAPVTAAARSGALGKLGKAIRRPGTAYRVGRSIMRGHTVRWWARLRGIRFECGRNLRIEGKLVLRGPGRVVFGDNVRVGMRVTPWTHHPDAVIVVGDDTFLNGAAFGCRTSIEVGPRCILARVHVMDTDFHSTHVNRHDPDAPVRTAPVRIGANVWLADQVGVLAGTEIGHNSVVGYGAVCSGKYPADVLIAGNPARVIRPLEGASSAPSRDGTERETVAETSQPR